MSNLEAAPGEVACAATLFDGVEVLQPREVPLGGPRAIRVRRTLPQRQRSLIGAWCFVDHYGPRQVSDLAGMDVPPHPHTGLQTASWLFGGEIEHRDSGGVHQLVRPGELNLMTAGAGICHSEVSTAATTVLHGVQLWVALPDAARNGPREFEHHVPQPFSRGRCALRVFLGELAGQRSPVHTFTPLLGGTNATLDMLLQFAVTPNATNISRLELFSTGGSVGLATNQATVVLVVAATDLGLAFGSILIGAAVSHQVNLWKAARPLRELASG